MALSIALIKTISPAQRHGLISTPLYHQLEGGSQTFKRGAPLLYNASGYLVEASNPVAMGEQIVGFAAEAGHNTTAGTYSVGYYPALPSIVFEGVLEDGTNFDHVLVQANLGMGHAIAKDTSSGAWYLDENNVADVTAVIVGFIEAVGTTKARVLFTVPISVTIYA